MTATEINFVHQDLKGDPIVEQILGPLTDHPNDDIVWLTPDMTLEDIWVHVGKFKSKSQARKNNHGGLIPPGYTEFRPKKGKQKSVFILNIFEE